MIKSKSPVEKSKSRLLLLGNPNVGKSVLFGILTGNYVTVSNYPGTTIEIIQGTAQINGTTFKVFDTPGINNLIPLSEDERVTRDMVLKNNIDLVLQVADTKNLRRALILSTQLAEMGIPFVLNLNMADEAKQHGITVDASQLEKKLGVPVVSTVATKRIGTVPLRESLLHPRRSRLHIKFDSRIEEAITKIVDNLPKEIHGKRAIALMLIAGDDTLEQWLENKTDSSVMNRIRTIRRHLQEMYPEPLKFIIDKERLEHIDRIIKDVYDDGTGNNQSFLKTLGRLMIHPLWGLFFLVGILFAMYFLVGVVGARYAVGFFENIVFGKYINPYVSQVINFIIPYPVLQRFLIGDYGMISMALTYGVAIILPIVVAFFLSFSVLEDCGYLPRLSVMLNRIFKMIGLNGRAIMPMVLGLGCVTMAMMTTRVLETRKERILTSLLLALAIPCSAQLGVIGGMMASVSGTGIIVWFSVVVSILLFIGYIGAKVIPGKIGDFVMELPPVRVPQLRNIVTKTIGRLGWYVKEVLPLFILGTALLFFLEELRLLQLIQKFFSPIVEKFLGLPAQAGDAFLIGFFRRDYGAAGLYHLQLQGLLNPRQVLVSMVTITLFIPCIATLFIMIKERGWKQTIFMSGFIFPFAFIVGGILNQILLYWKISF